MNLIWVQFGEFISELGKMKLGESLRYMFGMMLINRLESRKRITEEEKR